jgi:hypothetical protein
MAKLAFLSAATCNHLASYLVSTEKSVCKASVRAHLSAVLAQLAYVVVGCVGTRGTVRYIHFASNYNFILCFIQRKSFVSC